MFNSMSWLYGVIIWKQALIVWFVSVNWWSHLFILSTKLEGSLHILQLHTESKTNIFETASFPQFLKEQYTLLCNRAEYDINSRHICFNGIGYTQLLTIVKILDHMFIM